MATTLSDTRWMKPTFIQWLHLCLHSLGLHLLFGVMSEKVRKAFIISNLFSKLTNVNALEDAETYRKLNDLFKLSGSKSTLVFPSAYCKNLVDSGTIELLRKAVKEPEQEEQICDEVACKIPQQLKYADGVQVSRGDIRQLVDFTRQQGLVH